MIGTQIQAYIDSAHASRVLPGTPGHILKGGTLSINGWVLDTSAGQVATAIFATIDATFRTAAAPVERPDLVQHFRFPQAAKGGFTCRIDTNDLPFGDHEAHIVAEFADGSSHTVGSSFTFRVVPPVELPAATSHPPNDFGSSVVPPVALTDGNVPRILLACAPKTGSTFCATFLRAYFGITTPDIGMVTGATEHLLTDELLQRLGPRPGILQFHILPRPEHTDLIRKHYLSTVILWRNLADVVVSHDDEMDHAWYGASPGTGYMRDPQVYLKESQQARFQFFIRHLVPWYIGFYLSWRDVTAPLFFHYELLAVDKVKYFTAMLEGLRVTVDHQRLQTLVDQQFSKLCLSAGVNGRANEKFSDETKALLEEIITTYPCYDDDLAPLIDELPWRRGPAAVLNDDPKVFSAERNPMRRAPLWETFDTRS